MLNPDAPEDAMAGIPIQAPLGNSLVVVVVAQQNPVVIAPSPSPCPPVYCPPGVADSSLTLHVPAGALVNNQVNLSPETPLALPPPPTNWGAGGLPPPSNLPAGHPPPPPVSGGTRGGTYLVHSTLAAQPHSTHSPPSAESSWRHTGGPLLSPLPTLGDTRGLRAVTCTSLQEGGALPGTTAITSTLHYHDPPGAACTSSKTQTDHPAYFCPLALPTSGLDEVPASPATPDASDVELALCSTQCPRPNKQKQSTVQSFFPPLSRSTPGAGSARLAPAVESGKGVGNYPDPLVARLPALQGQALAQYSATSASRSGSKHIRFCPANLKKFKPKKLPDRLEVEHRRLCDAAGDTMVGLAPAMLPPGSIFPPPEARRTLEVLERDLYVARSGICPGLGLFSAVPLAKGVPLGLYSGTIRSVLEPTNAYSMAIQDSEVVVDGTPDPLHPWTWLGYMNCHRSNPDLNNATVYKNLIVKTNCKVAAHGELTINYSDAYPWVECDVQRFRLALEFVRVCLPNLGAELWATELDHLSRLATTPLDGVEEALLGDPASFPLWYTITHGLREFHPRLLHPYVPSALPDDSFSTWLCRFCSCVAVEHLLSWKDQWQGAHELCPPSFLPADVPEAKHHRAAHNHSRILDPACPLRGLQVDRITPWTCPDFGISLWISLMEPVQPTSPPAMSGGDRAVTPPPPSLPTEKGVHTPDPPVAPQRSSPEGDPPLTERSPSPLSPLADTGRDRGLAQASSGRHCLQDWRSLDVMLRLPRRLPNHDFKILTLNVGTLNDNKLQFILWYMNRQRIDVVSLIDTRHGAANLKPLKDMCRSLGAAGSTVYQTHVPAPSHQNAGGFFTILSPRASQHRVDAWNDKTRTGAVSALLFKFQADVIALVSTYWPVSQYSTGPGSLCGRVQLQLDTSHDARAPHEYIRDSITSQLEKWRRGARNFNPIIMGDFNVDLHGPTNDAVTDWMALNSLECLGPPAPTRKDSRTGAGGCLDHSLVTTPFRNRWSGITDSPDLWDSISDHFPILAHIKVDYLPLLKVRPLKELRPDLLLSDIPGCGVYSDAVEEWALAHDPMLSTATAGDALKELADFSAQTTWNVNRDLVKSIRRKKAKAHQIWSPMLIAIVARQTSIARARRLLLAKVYDSPHLLRRIQKLEDEFEAKCLSLKDGEATLREFFERYPLRLPELLLVGSKHRALRDAVVARKLLNKAQISTNCKRLRRQISNAVAKREDAFEARQYGKVIKSITGDRPPQVDMSILRDPDTGLLTSTPEDIAHISTKVFDKWYNPIVPHIFGDFEVNLACPAAHKQAFLDRCGVAGVPLEMGNLIWASIHNTSRPPVDFPYAPSKRVLVERDMQEAMAAPPTLAEFEFHLSSCPTNSAAGVSGLSYNMMHKWGPAARAFAHHYLTQLWLDRETPDWWKWRFLVPIGKGEEQAETDLANVRPLMLLEPLRKAWTGIFNLRFRKIRERHRILNESQHGFRPRRGCADALLQTHNLLESVNEMSDKLYLSTWDIRRAFDSISKDHILLAAKRAGCPDPDARWLADMDVGEKTIVRSPYLTGLDPKELRRRVLADIKLSFSAVKGTPQGDVLSPDVWDMFFDILLTALELDSVQQEARCFYTDLQGRACFARDTAFADDLLSHARLLPQFQRKADIVSAFAIIFGLTLLPSKIRAFICDWSGVVQREESFLVHTWGWTPSRVVFARTGVVKYLGSLISLDHSGTPELLKIRAMLNRVIAVISRRKASERAKLMVVAVSSMAKARYGATFAPLTLAQIRTLDAPISRFFRKLLQLMPSFPTRVLYMPVGAAGLGLPCLSTAIMKARVRVIQRSPVMDTQAAISGMLARFRRRMGRFPCPNVGWVTFRGDIRAANYDPSFLTAAIEWVEEMGGLVCQDGFRADILSLGLLTSLDPPDRAAAYKALDCAECFTLGEALHTGEAPIRAVNDAGVRTFLLGPGGHLLADLPDELRLQLAQDQDLHVSLIHHATHEPNSVMAAHPFTMHLRPHQCWSMLSPDPADHGIGIDAYPYRVIEILAFTDSLTTFYGRQWEAPVKPSGQYSRTPFFCASNQEGVGLHTRRQSFPISAILGPDRRGFLVSMSRDIPEELPDGTRRVHRMVRDSGLRLNVVHPLQEAVPSPSLEMLPALVAFCNACKALGPHILCTDGSWKRNPSAFEQMMDIPGAVCAGAAVVAIPIAALLPHERTPLPALFVKDVLGDCQHVYPLELLALGLVQWTGGLAKSATIYSDCQSAIDTIGKTEPTSEYYQVDQIHLPPFRVPVRKVAAHQDKTLRFTELDLPSQGNVLANDVAMGYTHYPFVQLKLFNLDFRDVLECGKRGRVVWGAMADSTGLVPLLSLADVASKALCEKYWVERVASRVAPTPLDYDWTLGHVRFAAKAADLSGRSIRSKASFVRLILDKYWRGSRHNPMETVCPHCATLPEHLGDPPLVGYEHWRNECSDPKVVIIREACASRCRCLINSTQGRFRHILTNLHRIFRADPLAFMGRFSTDSTASIVALLQPERQFTPSQLKKVIALGAAHVDAGRALQAIATPEQEAAWEHICAERKTALEKRALLNKIKKQKNADARKARAAKAIATRVATQPSQRTLGARPVLIRQLSQRPLHSYYSNPSGGDNRHDGDRLFGD